MVVSSILHPRALLMGEEFDADGFEDSLRTGAEPESPKKLQRRPFAAFIYWIDAQSHLLRQSVRATFVGDAITLTVWAAILWDKMG